MLLNIRIIYKAILITILLCCSGSIQAQLDLQFVNFEMSDTVTLGNTIELTGILYNNGADTIPANISMEVATEPEASSLPLEAYGASDFTENFYNPTLLPGESYTFTKQIWVDPQFISPNQNAIVVVWPVDLLTAPDADTTNNIYRDTIRVEDYRYKLSDYNRRTEPVILNGADLPGDFLGIAPTEPVAFRYEEDWIQIPVQIDEKALLDIVKPYGTYGNLTGLSDSTGTQEYFYTDPNTFTGADPDLTFDADDELVFMAKDAGGYARTNTEPPGVIPGTGVQLTITDPLNGDETYVYLYRQDGSLIQDTGISYVDYQFQLANGGAYPQDYDFQGSNTEDTEINTAYYNWHFSDTWISDGLTIKLPDTDSTDILDQHLTLFGPDICGQNEVTFSQGMNVLISNKTGPIRAIRSYMGAGGDPLTQRTHFFYEGRQDISTNIRTSPFLFHADLFDYDAAQTGMQYVSNSFIDGRVIDGEQDDILTSLPLQWEMVSGSQGSVIMVHNVSTQDTIFPYKLSNYWGDDTDSPDYNCSGDGLEYGSSGVIINTPNNCTDPLNNNCISTDFLKLTRSVYYAEANLEVIDAFVHQQYIRHPMELSWSAYEPPCYKLNLSVWLQGPYNDSMDNMNTELNNRGLLPGQTPATELALPTIPGQPYNVTPWNHNGIEGATFADNNYTNTDVDWMLVSLQDSNRFTIAQTAGLVRADGNIRFEKQHCPLESILGINALHISLEHRNHARITTVDPVTLDDNKIAFDFRNPPNTPTPSNYGYKQISSGIWGMFAGDVDKINDQNGYDINSGDKIIWLQSNGVFDQYLNTDFNLNGTTDGADKTLWAINNGIFIPLIPD